MGSINLSKSKCYGSISKTLWIRNNKRPNKQLGPLFKYMYIVEGYHKDQVITKDPIGNLYG